MWGRSSHHFPHVRTHTHTEYSVPYTKVRSTSRRTPKRVASKLPLHRHHSLKSLILPLFFTLLYNTAKIHVHTLNQHKQLLVCQICYKRNDCTTGHCISLVYMCTPDEKKNCHMGSVCFLSNIQTITGQNTRHTYAWGLSRTAPKAGRRLSVFGTVLTQCLLFGCTTEESTTPVALSKW